MELLKNLNWRYATKKFDPSKKVSTDDLEKLKKAIQLSVSSYGLQLYKVLIIENKEIREQLKPVSWNQSQITDSSHLFVFCNYIDVSDDAIDDFIKQTAEIRGLDLERLNGYGNFIKTKLFKPFKTTKGASGMGIGVYEAREIVLSLGGGIDVHSEYGKGTSFIVRIPVKG